MTSLWVDRLLPSDARLLSRFYPTEPHLTGLTLRSVRFERYGPGCILRIDLPVASDVPGYRYIQAHLGFPAVDDVRMFGGPLPVMVSIEFTEWPQRRLAVTVTGESLRLSLTCADQIRFGRISFHNSSPDIMDDGTHQFTSKFHQLLHNVVPGPEDTNYHEYI
jgi:hypothetical protein